MTVLQHKIDFVEFVAVSMANPNGDPLNGNRPRVNYDGYGEISDVCIKRKIRNRMQDLGAKIFVQSEERSDDKFKSLRERADSELKGIKDKTVFAEKACKIWSDVRSFGQVFAFKGNDGGSDDKKDKKGLSVGVRGPVSIHLGVSVNPVEVRSMQITKSVIGDSKAGASDTMGQKHFVRFGLYKIKGSINVQLAEKTGFSEDDANLIKECLRTLFENDASAARPEGSMEVCRLYWWKHNNKVGQYSTAQVHRSVNAVLKYPDKMPTCFDDYEIKCEPLEGLEPEIL